MDQQTKNILTTAHANQNLAALHIDLQAKFHPDLKKDMYLPKDVREKNARLLSNAFTNAAKFKDNLEGLNIPNIWVAYVGSEAQTIDKPYKARDMIFDKPRDEFYITVPSPNDLILPKTSVGLFAQTHSYNPLDSLPETIIADGVLAEGCVMQSLAETFARAHAEKRPLNVIVAHDAMDIENADYYLLALKESTRIKCPELTFGEGNPYQLATARTTEIISHIKTLQP